MERGNWTDFEKFIVEKIEKMDDKIASMDSKLTLNTFKIGIGITAITTLVTIGLNYVLR